jgi:hypothetical protein
MLQWVGSLCDWGSNPPQDHFCRYVYKYVWRKTSKAKSLDYFKPCLLSIANEVKECIFVTMF